MDDNKTLLLNNIRPHHCLLILTSAKGLELYVDGNTMNIPPNSLVFIEKYMLLNVRFHYGNCPKVVSIDDSIMRFIFNFLLDIFDYKSIDSMSNSRIYFRQAVLEDKYLFARLKKHIDEDASTKATKTTIASIVPIALYFFIEFDLNIIRTISRVVKPTTTDKVLEILSRDLSKSWKLQMISEEMFMSEISLRKRLENEGTTFMKVLTNARMMYSLKLLTMTDYNINIIASKVSYSSTSYFIRTFKQHFGITPKQIIPALQ
ncbi:helix-turn-helix transcriptional regulator [Salmonella enterica]